jgi:hypothetical protein
MKHQPWAGSLVAGMALVLAIAAFTSAQETPPATGDETGASGTTSRGEALPGGAPEIATYKTKVVFVVDRSGSMGLADRFLKALDVVDQLLVEMQKDTMFDMYLISENQHSLFGGEWLRPSGDVRKSMKKRIAQAGGLEYGGFTDLVSALKLATERRRPDAVYLLSDGVNTIGELETEKIIGSVAKVALDVKIPVHTIGVGLGQDLAEDGEEAARVLKGIAEATGGKYREVKSEKRSTKRAFMLPPPWAPPPPDELVRIHIRGLNNKEIFPRTIGLGGKAGVEDFNVDVEDPALKYGPVALEYAEPKLTIRTFLANGKLFSETRPIGMKRVAEHLHSTVGLRLVGVSDDAPPDEVTSNNILPVKVPSNGSIEIVYKRGSREFRESAVIVFKQGGPG